MRQVNANLILYDQNARTHLNIAERQPHSTLLSSAINFVDYGALVVVNLRHTAAAPAAELRADL